MADAAPWTKWFHEDFLQGVALANMEAAEIGVYAVVLNLMAARGGPIEDDRRWIAGRAGCKSTRQCSAILARLIAAGKLVSRNGMLGNAKMLGVVQQRDQKSNQARRAALARWHGDDLELPLDQPPQQGNGDLSGRKSAGKNADNPQLTGAIKSQQPRKTANGADADASPPVGARDSETQINNLTLPTPDTAGVEAKPDATGGSGPEEKEQVGRLADADLHQLYEAVAQASGHNPSQPAQIDRAMRFVENWKKDGIDFEQVVVPTIKAVISESRDPTRTLGRFDARIRHEHARVAATPKGRAYAPPASPVMEPEGEDPMFRPARVQLLEAFGPHGYAQLLNHVRFSVVADAMGGRKPVKMEQVGSGTAAQQLTDGDRRSMLMRAMRPLGFTDVWYR